MRVVAWALAAVAAVALGPAAGQTPEQPEACTSEPPAIVEFEVLSCRPGALAIEEQIAGVRLWWLRPFLESVASSNPGVVVRGRVIRSRVIEGPETVARWLDGGGEEDLFYTSSDPDFCRTFEGLDATQLVREEPCCDVIPPVSVACVLDLFEARALTPALQELAKSYSWPPELER